MNRQFSLKPASHTLKPIRASHHQTRTMSTRLRTILSLVRDSFSLPTIHYAFESAAAGLRHSRAPFERSAYSSGSACRCEGAPRVSQSLRVPSALNLRAKIRPSDLLCALCDLPRAQAVFRAPFVVCRAHKSSAARTSRLIARPSSQRCAPVAWMSAQVPCRPHRARGSIPSVVYHPH